MKEFIYQLIDVMWFWTSEEIRLIRASSNGSSDIFSALYWLYLLGTLIPICFGTLIRYLINEEYQKSFPIIKVNDKAIVPTKKFIKSLIHVQVIENILFWLIFNTMLLALPLGIIIIVYLILGISRGICLLENDTSRFTFTISQRYFFNKLKHMAKKQALEEISKHQENYLTIEKQFLNDLSKYKNEGSTNLLQAGVN